MPRAQRLRLLAAAHDYVESYSGDGGGGARRAQGEVPGMSTVQQLIGELESAESSGESSTPGQRAVEGAGGKSRSRGRSY